MRSVALREERVTYQTDWSGLVLIAEDELASRRGLAEFLQSRGFKTRTARSGREAVTLAASLRPAVVVMDLHMPGELDGIAAACQIQQAHPAASIVFVTAYFDDPQYRQRTATAGLQVAAWISKPLTRERRDLLVGTLRREGPKSRIRAAMAEARARGVAPAAFRVDHLVEPEVQELLEEVRREGVERDMLEPHVGAKLVPATSSRIDSLYVEIRSLVGRSAADPSLRGEIDSRMTELRRLQAQEAAEMERRYEASLGFRPGAFAEMLERATRALGDA